MGTSTTPAPASHTASAIDTVRSGAWPRKITTITWPANNSSNVSMLTSKNGAVRDIARHTQHGGRETVADGEPLRLIGPAQQPVEVAGRERVTRADRVHDIDGRRGQVHAPVRAERGGALAGILHHKYPWLGEQVADLVRARRAPQDLRLVTPGEDNVGVPRQLGKHMRGPAGRPQGGPVIDIEDVPRAGDG